MSGTLVFERSSWRWGIAVVLTAAGALHIAALGSLPEFHGRLPWRVEWPHTLHLWLLEALAGLAGLAAPFWSALRAFACGWLEQQTPSGRAIAMGALLVCVEAGLAGGYWMTWPYGVESLGWLRAIFYLGGEFTPAAFFSTLQFWMCAWFAWRLFATTSQHTWLIAVTLCAYLGLDELLSIHEFVGRAGYSRGGIVSTLEMLEALGMPLYSWQVIFFPVAGGVALFCVWRFAGLVSPRELAGLALAGAVFLTGAMGFEAVEARAAKLDPVWWAGTGGHLNLMLEETFEMLGVTIAVVVLAQRYWRVVSDAGVPAHPSASSALPPLKT